jgi:Integrase core domain
MSRRGNPYDNAYAERFMRTLKEEEVYGADYRDLDDARSRIGQFLEQVYNRQRLHSALRYRTPEEFEQLSYGRGSDGTDGSGGKLKNGLPPLPQALEIPPGLPHSRGSTTAKRQRNNNRPKCHQLIAFSRVSTQGCSAFHELGVVDNRLIVEQINTDRPTHFPLTLERPAINNPERSLI